MLDKCIKNQNRLLRYIWFIIAIAIPVYLASVRSLDVGIDVRVYAYPYARLANENNFFRYMSLMFSIGIEPGYSILNFIGEKSLGGICGVFFITQILVITPVYLRLYRKKSKFVFMEAMIYLLLFYNLSLNLMRQAIALSIIYFAYEFIEKEKYEKFIAFVFLASMFHYSAVLGLMLLLLHIFVNGRKQNIRIIILYIVLIMGVGLYNPICKFVFGTVFKYNTRYLHAFLANTTGYISTWNVLFNLLIIGSIILNKNYLKKLIKYYEYLGIALSNIMLYMLIMYNGNAFRFSLYFLIFAPEIVTLMICKFKGKNRICVCCVVLLLYLWHWYNFNVLSDSYGTFPFAFMTGDQL